MRHTETLSRDIALYLRAEMSTAVFPVREVIPQREVQVSSTPRATRFILAAGLCGVSVDMTV